MKRVSIFVVLALCAVLLAVAAPAARATGWDKLTYVTISGPVQIPGMTLDAGKYMFRLADDQGNRNIVQIWDRDRMHLYATVLTIADYRLWPTGDTVILFKEAPVNEAPALKAWFYPGDNFGQEFVYPKSQAEALAQVNHEQVPSTPDQTANSMTPTEDQNQNTDTTAGVTPSTPTQPTEDQTPADQTGSQMNNPPEDQTPQSPTTDQNQNQNQSQNQDQTQTDKTLPKTASPMPLVAFCGLILIGAGFGLRIFVKKAT